MTLSYRPVITIDINDKAFDKVRIANPELIVLTHKGNTMDVGALCYQHRGRAAAFKPGGKVLGCQVDKSSLVPGRRQSILLIAEHLIDYVRLGGSVDTAFKHYKMMQAFYVYCDSLNDLVHDFVRKETLIDYTQHLRTQLAQNKISNATASERQSLVCRLYAAHHNINVELVYGSDIPLIKSKIKQSKPTPPLDDNQLAKTTSLCRSIFDAACRVGNGEPLPLFFDSPEGKACFSPQIPTLYLHKNMDTFTKAAKLSLNWDNEKINGIDDIKDIAISILGKRHAKAPSRYLHRFQQAEMAAAKEPRGTAHMEAVNFGVSCFFNLFLAATGLNLSTAINLRWSDKYEFKENSQGLREVVIKPRAGYKEVSFTITAVFKPLLLKYLKLRDHILNGRESDHLFIVFSSKPRPCFDLPTKLVESRYSSLRDTLSRRAMIDYLPTARELRVTRSDFNIRKHGLLKAAELNGNNIETTMKHYASSSRSRAATALSPFYKKIRDAAYQAVKNTPETHVEFSSDPDSEIPIKTGHCASFMNPALSIEFNNKSPAPACEKSAHGCLFCENYRLHISRDDIRKLLSMMECIYLIRSNARSLEHFESAWGAVIERVDDIFASAIKQRPEAAELIEQIKEEVAEDGELDPYWLSHYNMVKELMS